MVTPIYRMLSKPWTTMYSYSQVYEKHDSWYPHNTSRDIEIQFTIFMRIPMYTERITYLVWSSHTLDNLRHCSVSRIVENIDLPNWADHTFRTKPCISPQTKEWQKSMWPVTCVPWLHSLCAWFTMNFACEMQVASLSVPAMADCTSGCTSEPTTQSWKDDVTIVHSVTKVDVDFPGLGWLKGGDCWFCSSGHHLKEHPC